MKPTITLFIGGGQTEIYRDCEIDHQLSPELTSEMTFTGYGPQLSPYVWAPSHCKQVRVTTSCAYKIEFPVEENHGVSGDSNSSDQ